MTEEPRLSDPPTEEELAKLEAVARHIADRTDASDAPSVHGTLRLLAEIRRLRALATCEACAAGLRLAPGGLHYHGEDKDGATWGVCRTVVAAGERAELLRLREARR